MASPAGRRITPIHACSGPEAGARVGGAPEAEALYAAPMGAFKSLVDKARAKKEELEKQAAQKAAEKAAEVAIERGKQAARAVVTQAGESLSRVGASIEEALFGPDSEAEPEAPEPKRKEEARETPRSEATRAVKRAAPTPAADHARFEREVDEELAALKRKLGKPK